MAARCRGGTVSSAAITASWVTMTSTASGPTVSGRVPLGRSWKDRRRRHEIDVVTTMRRV